MTKLSDTQRVILSRAAQHEALLAEPPAKLPAAARQSVLRSLIAKGLLQEVPAPREAVGLGWRQDEDGAWIAMRITSTGLQAIGVEPEGAAPTDAGTASEGNTPPVASPAPTVAQGAALAAIPPAPLSHAEATSAAPQSPPTAPQAGRPRASALHATAAALLAAWETTDRPGLDDAVAALRNALEQRTSPSSRRLNGTSRQPRSGTKQEAVLTLLCRAEGATIAQVIDATGWQPHTVRGFLAGLKRRGITVEVLERVRQVGPDKQGARGSYSIYRIAAMAG